MALNHAYAERPVNTFPHPNTKPFHKGMPFGEENKATVLQKSSHYIPTHANVNSDTNYSQ